ncbi:hypothetical protein C8F01DRAFT_1164903 [Mycena amicta]|nr:hypothetical protein C8F01DRAFT_1164903 [Mycena amicta]
MAGLRLTIPTTPPSSPCSSMPELVSANPSPLNLGPIDYRLPSVANRRSWVDFQNQLQLPAPSSPVIIMAPRPATPAFNQSAVAHWRQGVVPLPPRPFFVDDSPALTPVFTVSPASGSGFRGSFNPSSSVVRVQGPRKSFRSTKRRVRFAPVEPVAVAKKPCFFCTSVDHLIRRCPKLDLN